MKIYESAVKKPITTILVFVAIVLMGLFAYSRLAIDLLPEIETTQLTVMTLKYNNVFESLMQVFFSIFLNIILKKRLKT